MILIFFLTAKLAVLKNIDPVTTGSTWDKKNFKIYSLSIDVELNLTTKREREKSIYIQERTTSYLMERRLLVRIKTYCK